MKNLPLFLASFLFTMTAFAAPPGSPYDPAETLDPTCAPGDANCFVELALEAGSVVSDADPSTNLAGATAGDVAYNTTTGYLQVYNGSAWANVNTDIYSANGIVGAGRTVGVTDTLTFDGNIFHIDGTNNRVGIATLVPFGGSADRFSVLDEVGAGFGIGGRFMNFYSANSGIRSQVAGDDAGAQINLRNGSTGELEITPAVITGVQQDMIFTAGNVGIGDLAPDAGLKLDVEGKVGATEYCDEDGLNCVAAGSFGGGSSNTIYSANDTIGAGRTVGVTDTVNFDSNTFVIDGTNNRVGIGVAAPGQALVVNSGAADGIATFQTTDNLSDFRLNGSVSGGGTYYFQPGNLGAESRVIFNEVSGNVGFGGSWTPQARVDITNAVAGEEGFRVASGGNAADTQLIVDENGSVGVGVHNPTSKFHVQETQTGTSGATYTGRNYAIVTPSANSTGLHTAGLDQAIVTGTNDVSQTFATYSLAQSTATAGNQTNLYGAYSQSQAAAGAANMTNVTGLFGIAQSAAAHTGTIANMSGGQFSVQNSSAVTLPVGTGVYGLVQPLADGNVTTANGIRSTINLPDGSSASITDAYAFRAEAYTSPTATGTIDNAYGLYITDMDGATSDYGVYQVGTNDDNYFAGNVGIGTDEPNSPLEIESSQNPTSDGSVALRLDGSFGGALALEDGSFQGTIYTNTTGINKLVLATHAVGASAPSSQFVLTDNGNVGIGAATPDSKLSVVGLPSGTDDTVTPGGLAGAVCITDAGNMYIDTDGTCAN